MSPPTENLPIPTHAPQHPATKRPVATNLADSVKKPGVARATYAGPRSDGSVPKFYNESTPAGAGHRTYAGAVNEGEDWEDLHPDPSLKGQSALQKHCAFFDHGSKGYVTPYDTYLGFRELGFNVLYSLAAIFVINATFSYPTVHGWLPDPFFRIYLDKAERMHHGSDTQTYDNEGRFIPQKFEDAFTKFGSGEGEDATLSRDQMFHMLWANRDLLDLFGQVASFLEWITTYVMLWPEDRKMRKEDLRGLYDGSIFYAIRTKRQQQQQEKAGRVSRKKE